MKKRFVISCLCGVAILAWSAVSAAQATQDWDVYSDTWEAVDALGRRLPTNEQVGPPREGKQVGIFYFLWLGESGEAGPFDITKILKKNPNAMQEPDNPAWGPMYAPHHWGESVFGYYRCDDPYVLKKHARMLSDAGVDAVIFDVTNQLTYPKSYTALGNAFTEVRALGERTPQMAFLCPFWDPAKVVPELHTNLYAPGLFKELWYSWDGKPLVLADPAKVDPSLRDFFTYRKPVPSYFTGPDGPDQWGWLEIYPQHVFRNSAGEAEQMTVGVAQNAVGDRLGSMSEPDARGRSYPSTGRVTEPDAVLKGLNVAEQWERALKEDPEFIFITGWNEWIAGRFNEFGGVKAPVMFVDEFDQEHSRDIEPMRGGHGDNYYYQMIGYIRRFKGAQPQPIASAPATIKIDGEMSDWKEVGPEFRDHRKSAVSRNHPGWGDTGVYKNNSGRNDFVLMKVARDSENLYFYVKTGDPISMYVDPHWMMLFIDVDRNHDTGWEGYDFLLNRATATNGRSILEYTDSGWKWRKAAEIPYRIREKEMELMIPRAALRIAPDAPVDIEFKWSDNMVREDQIMEFTVNGDAAPPGRFNYRYREQ